MIDQFNRQIHWNYIHNVITREDEKKKELDPSATEFHLKRTAAEIWKLSLKDIAFEKDDDTIW